MADFVMHGKVKVMQGTKTYEWLTSKNPDDKKKAKRMIDFCFKAAALYYKNPEYTELRKEYSDVL